MLVRLQLWNSFYKLRIGVFVEVTEMITVLTKKLILSVDDYLVALKNKRTLSMIADINYVTSVFKVVFSIEMETWLQISWWE